MRKREIRFVITEEKEINSLPVKKATSDFFNEMLCKHFNGDFKSITSTRVYVLAYITPDLVEDISSQNGFMFVYEYAGLAAFNESFVKNIKRHEIGAIGNIRFIVDYAALNESERDDDEVD